MKTFTYFALAAAAILFTSFKSLDEKTSEPETSVCLEIVGIALDETNKPIDGVEVKLYKENEELEWNEMTSVTYHDHSFVFNLDANEYYTIEISKNGFVSRSIAISTKLPAGVSAKPIFHYEFEVSLFKVKSGDNFYFDFPIAIISYDSKKDVFDNSYHYTNHIKSRIMESSTVFKTNSAAK